MKKHIKYKYDYLFLLALISISLLYGYHIILFDPPYSMHQWRQADGLSITLNYFKEGMNFFEPKIHFQYSDHGRAIGEFPIIYYLNAAIWKITGQSYFTARLVNLLIVFAGFFALYKTIYLVIKNYFVSFFIPLLIFSSPLIAFYSNNFLLNVPALSLIFISWYYFVRYTKEKKITYLALFSLFASLSILLRATMLIGICPIFLLFFLEKTKLFKPALFTHKFWLELLLLSLPCVLIFLWLTFISNYNASNHSIYFLTQTKPIWSLKPGEIIEIWYKFSENIMPTVYHRGILSLIAISIVLLFILIKHINKYLLVFNLVIISALFLYVILWFSNLNVHDYYLIELFLLIPPLFLSLFLYSKDKLNILYQSKKVKILLVLILFFSLAYSTLYTRLKYDLKKSSLTYLLLPEQEIKLWGWYHWDYANKFKAYETITPYLRKIGIKRDDIVVSIPDQSPNISLFFMDQKGYTSLYQDGKPIKEQLDYFMTRGARYLIVNDTSLYQNEDFIAYRQNKIGEYKNIEIYKLTDR